MQNLTIVLFGFAMATLLSCRARAPYELQHEERRPVEWDLPLLWHDVTDADYDRFITHDVIEARNDKEKVQFVTPTSPKYIQIEKVINDFDAMLREKFPGAISAVPKPKLKMVARDPKVPMVNAFVAPFPICFKLPVKLSNGSKIYPHFEKAAIAIRSDGFFSHTASVDLAECIVKEINSELAKALVNRINNNAFNRDETNCSLSLTGNGGLMRIELGKECKIHPDLVALTSQVNYVAIGATGNAITVYEDLVDALGDANQVAGVVAHELGHYYKAHPSLDHSLRNYFYDLEKYTTSGNPPRNKELDHLGSLAVLITPPGEVYVKPVGGKFDPQLYEIMTDIVTNNICDEDHFCPPTCKDIETPPQNFNDNDKDSREYDKDDVKKYESRVLECFKDVKVLQGSIARENFTKANSKTATVDALEVAFSMEHDYVYTHRCVGKSPEVVTLHEFVNKMNEKIKAPLCNQRTVLAQAQQKLVGFYTVEQEADDFALEALFLKGLPVTTMSGAMLKLAEKEGDVGCKKWVEKQKERSVPILESYTDLHHDDCFRWHNIEQEIKRHNYLGR